MKIYINHFNLDILSDLIKNLNEYHVNTEEYIQIFSSDGLYKIDQASTLKLNPVDHDILILNNFYKNFNLIVDPSFYIIEKVVQIPLEHIASKIKRNIFSIHSNSRIKLIIETDIYIKSQTDFSFLNTENGEHPIDIYFELPNGTNIEDTLVKEELIEFLSILN